MMKGYKITYMFEGKEYWTMWYANDEKTAKNLFKMWHTGCEILSVERNRK